MMTRCLSTTLPRAGLAALSLILTLASVPFPARAEKIQTYIFDIQKTDGHKPLTLVVEPKEGYTLITYHNEFKDREISAFNPKMQILYAQYFDPQQRETATVTYDYDLKRITLRGLANATYTLADHAYENNGSLFYLFGFLQPVPGHDHILNLTQGNLSHIEDPFQRMLLSKLVGPVEMYLRCKDTEVLEIGGNTRTARHFELGIHDARLAFFWPKVYHFWYSTENPSFLLKYQGSNPKNEVEIITFVAHFEREAPPEEPPVSFDIKR